MSPAKKTPKKLAHPAVFVNCSQEEHDTIHAAVKILSEDSGLTGSVSTWARTVLLREATKIVKEKR